MTFAGVTLTEWGPEALLAMFVIAILLGWLVPYRVVKEKDKRIAFLEETLRTSEGHVTKLTAVADLARATWEAAGRANTRTNAEGDRTPGVTG